MTLSLLRKTLEKRLQELPAPLALEQFLDDPRPTLAKVLLNHAD